MEKSQELLLSDKQLSRIIGRSLPTLRNDRALGTGIPFVRFGRQIKYRVSDVEAFIAKMEPHASTSEYDGRHRDARRGGGIMSAPKRAIPLDRAAAA